MSTAIHLCSFSSGIDDMKRKDQRDLDKVLDVLERQPRKRFSVFEVTDNMVIARTMQRVVDDGYIKTDISCGYPWTAYTVTEKGKARLEEYRRRSATTGSLRNHP